MNPFRITHNRSLELGREVGRLGYLPAQAGANLLIFLPNLKLGRQIGRLAYANLAISPLELRGEIVNRRNDRKHQPAHHQS